MSAHLIALDTTPDLVDRVHRALRDAICDGDLAPGARLTQEWLAERLGVSRQPVLQALRLLRAEGFVHDAPARGVVVASIDAGQVMPRSRGWRRVTRALCCTQPRTPMPWQR